MNLDSVHQLIIDFIEKTNRPIFLTGKAGTGKTTFLRYIRSTTQKNLAVVAPTAVAAINAGGVTIHSFFQMPFGPVPPNPGLSSFAEFSGKSFGAEKSKILKCLDLLIIDEVSMVRADTIDYIDRVLRFVRGSNRPFGGIQVLMIGDLYQLPPVFQNDWHLLGRYYKGPYFFDSLVFSAFPLLTFELTTVHRQSDPTFIQILNDIRSGTIEDGLLEKLNESFQPDAAPTDHVTLTTHNPLVKKINDERLEQLPGVIHRFQAKVTGDFPKEAYPAEDDLALKAGAMVMFIKNDSSGKKQFYNGRTAKVEAISGDSIQLTFLDDGSSFEAIQETWENTKYTLSESDQKVSQTSAGSFTQFPLRLAWAITIHKSQGLTFDKAVVDVGAAFAHGQTYVALSRCRNLEGLILKEKVTRKNIITDPAVVAFMKGAQGSGLDQPYLQNAVLYMDAQVLVDSFDFDPILVTWRHFRDVLTEIMPMHASLPEQLNSHQELLEKKIHVVAQRFIQKELNLSNNVPAFDLIKDRLVKAADYFLPFLTTLHENVSTLHEMAEGAPFHTDYFPTLNLLLEQLETKKEVFKQLAQRKEVNDLVQTFKRKASSYKSVDTWKKKENTAIVIENPKLYSEIENWRKHAALQQKTLDYLILSNQAMADISAKMPRNLMQLAKIKNVGDGKATTYGDQILKLIRQHVGENDLFS